MDDWTTLCSGLNFLITLHGPSVRAHTSSDRIRIFTVFWFFNQGQCGVALIPQEGLRHSRRLVRRSAQLLRKAFQHECFVAQLFMWHTGIYSRSLINIIVVKVLRAEPRLFTALVERYWGTVSPDWELLATSKVPGKWETGIQHSMVRAQRVVRVDVRGKKGRCSNSTISWNGYKISKCSHCKSIFQPRSHLLICLDQKPGPSLSNTFDCKPWSFTQGDHRFTICSHWSVTVSVRTTTFHCCTSCECHQSSYWWSR